MLRKEAHNVNGYGGMVHAECVSVYGMQQQKSVINDDRSLLRRKSFCILFLHHLVLLSLNLMKRMISVGSHLAIALTNTHTQFGRTHILFQ